MHLLRRLVVGVATAGLICLSAAAAGHADFAASSGAKIVFSRGNINIGTAIWTVAGDGGSLVQITHPPRSARDITPACRPTDARSPSCASLWSARTTVGTSSTAAT